jgi:hypothetical protein
MCHPYEASDGLSTLDATVNCSPTTQSRWIRRPLQTVSLRSTPANVLWELRAVSGLWSRRLNIYRSSKYIASHSHVCSPAQITAESTQYDEFGGRRLRSILPATFAHGSWFYDKLILRILSLSIQSLRSKESIRPQIDSWDLDDAIGPTLPSSTPLIRSLRPVFPKELFQFFT